MTIETWYKVRPSDPKDCLRLKYPCGFFFPGIQIQTNRMAQLAFCISTSFKQVAYVSSSASRLHSRQVATCDLRMASCGIQSQAMVAMTMFRQVANMLSWGPYGILAWALPNATKFEQVGSHCRYHTYSLVSNKHGGHILFSQGHHVGQKSRILSWTKGLISPTCSISWHLEFRLAMLGNCAQLDTKLLLKKVFRSFQLCHTNRNISKIM